MELLPVVVFASVLLRVEGTPSQPEPCFAAPRYPNQSKGCPPHYTVEVSIPCVQNLKNQRPSSKTGPQGKNTSMVSIDDCISCREVDCCPGYWGRECRPCPGPHGGPLCSGHGSCLDGRNGTGICVCKEGFMGTACERCTSPEVYGPDCNQTCQCGHGICNSGIHGNGSCDCHQGYTGPFCSKQCVKACGENSHCSITVDGEGCVCNHGYEEKGLKCTAISRCQDGSAECHQAAACTETGPGTYNCTCRSGYQGDGYECDPIDPCQDPAGKCPPESAVCVYTGPNKYRCDCLHGYENFKENVGCSLINVCAVSPSICHVMANCSVTGPDIVNCVCKSGYSGDGKDTCLGSILTTLRDLDTGNSSLQGRLTTAIRLYTYALGNALTNYGPFTVFVPVNEGFDGIQVSKLLSNKHAARTMVKQHILGVQRTLEELTYTTKFYTLEGSSAELVYNYKSATLRYRLHGDGKKAKVLLGDVEALNGIVHVTDRILDRPPVIGHKKRQSIQKQIMDDGRYNRLQSLLTTAGLDELLEGSEPMTLFAPNNKAWDRIPRESMTFLLSTEGRGKLIAIVKNHVVSGTTVLSENLTQTHAITTMANNVVKVNLTWTGRIVLDDRVHLIQTDIPASNGYFHHVDEVLIPPYVKPIVKRHCFSYRNITVEGPCFHCLGRGYCPQPTDIAVGHDFFPARCAPVDHMECALICRRLVKDKCCSGFYGPSCDRCPGFSTPCNGHGVCADGMDGPGTCICNDAYEGEACEDCVDRNTFGPFCNETCQCNDDQVCVNGPKGTGACRNLKCSEGSLAWQCLPKTRITCPSFSFETDCHPHAHCAQNMGKRRCKCNAGYFGDGVSCRRVNPCLMKNGGCHSQAECNNTSEGVATCSCHLGWVGNGRSHCYPSTVCTNHSSCHCEAFCEPSTPGEFVCVCRAGYHGNGTHCVRLNMCEEENGGCDETASCLSTGPGTRICQCRDQDEGDGITCIGTILQQMERNKMLGTFMRLIYENSLTEMLLNISSNYTVFAPDNAAIALFNDTFLQFVGEEQEALLLYHLIPGTLSSSKLRQLSPSQLTTLDGKGALNLTSLNGELRINGVLLTQNDSLATNGLIHEVSQMLFPPWYHNNIMDIFTSTEGYRTFGNLLVSTGLISQLENLSEYTIFVPDSETFNWNLTADVLLKILSYHIVHQRLLPKDMLFHKYLTLLGQGPSSLLNFSGTTRGKDILQVKVNGIEVQIDGQRTMKGAVYGLTGVLMPNLNRCDVMSERGVYVMECCSGFYGLHCRQCPGRNNTPCNSHGTCNDGIDGTGLCKCTQGFLGESCDLCAAGFTGPNCEPDPCFRCHVHAVCQTFNSGTSKKCQCLSEYTGDGYECVLRCSVQNGGCHENAICEVIDNTANVSCTCSKGYLGDGKVCQKIVQLCKNITGYGGCHKDAVCKLVKLQDGRTGQMQCMCNAGLVGNGTMCNGNTLATLATLDLAKQFYNIVLSIPPTNPEDDNLTALLGDPSKKFTLFIPAEWSLSSNYIANIDIVNLIGNYILSSIIHLIPSSRLSNVTTISGTTLTIQTLRSEVGTVQYSVNGVPVLQSNIPTTNGIIHIIAKPLVVSVPTSASARGSVSNIVKPIVVSLVLLTIFGVAILLLVKCGPRTLRRIRTRRGISFQKLVNEPVEPSKLNDIRTDDVPDLFMNPAFEGPQEIMPLAPDNCN